MDDLAGLDWSSSSAKSNGTSSGPNYSSPSLNLRSLPLSGQSTPLSLPAQSSGQRAPISATSSKPATPANDSFSNLLSRKGTNQNAALSMQERQKQLIEEKARQDEEQTRKLNSQFGNHDAVWESFGSGKSTPDPTFTMPSAAATGQARSLSATINKPFAAIRGQGAGTSRGQGVSDSDLLAAFNSDAPVDKSSHFPAPSIGDSRSSTPAHALNKDGFISSLNAASSPFETADDDDPFGLGSMPQKQASTPAQTSADAADDDVLGLLGQPVTSKQTLPSSQKPVSASSEITVPDVLPPEARDPRYRAVSELVDMGFPSGKAADALAQTDYNVSAAVGVLLNAAHEESRQKSRGETERRPTPQQDRTERVSRRETKDTSVPAWMRDQDRSQSGPRRQNSQSPAPDKDVAQYAQDFGTSFLKGANSLWKAGKKNVQRAVADFNQDSIAASGDPSQPKWMRDAIATDREAQSRRQNRPENMTDEAMLLEGGGRPQKASKQPQQQHENGLRDGPRDFAQARPDARFADLQRPASRPRSPPGTRQSPALTASTTSSRKFKFDDEAASEAYTSSARRRNPASTPAQAQTPKPVAPAIGGSVPPSRTPAAAVKTLPRPSPGIAPRSRAPPRQVPSVSLEALAASASHRNVGSAAFKRGDYAAAHSSYSSALGSLGAPSHPISIVILCNRATTSLKTGDAKATVDDADRALEIIGPGLGHDENIDLGDGKRQMREFYGKALMRKAEGLEHMEKWSEALIVWKTAIEAGVGGSVSMQGRQRCEKAVGGGSSRPAAPKAAPPKRTVPAKAAAPIRPQVSQAASAEAVKKLREANAAAEKMDDEKFQLSDSVDAKLADWKGTKSDNLRALLGSLDKVMWPEAGWKKVGMQDLVLPNKVKIVYMKAIAKVHPDKIPQNASTEQKMISAAVFSVLNEAWDKFKQENGL